LAILIAIAGVIVGLIASLSVAYEMAGSKGIIGALVLFPYTFAYFPIYTLLLYGSWNLLLLNYGSIALSWRLLVLADRKENLPSLADDRPSTQPVATKTFIGRRALLIILLTACGFIFASIISSVTRSVAAPELAGPSKPKIVATKTPPVYLHACVTDSTIRVRKGPGTKYETIGGLVSGTCMALLGRNQDSSWVYMVADDNTAGWVAAELLTIEGEVSRLSVRSASNISQP
jgi:hypothetical protein